MSDEEKRVEALRMARDVMDGASTLLTGLAEYDGVEPDVKNALDIVTDKLVDAVEQICAVL